MKRILIIPAVLLFFLATNAQVSTTTIKQPVSGSVSMSAVAFRAAATYISGEPMANVTEQKVNFTGVYFDESKNFSITTDEFTAPANGIYHFDLRVFWTRFSAQGTVTLLLRTNLYEQIAMQSVQTVSTTQNFDSNFGTLMKLKAGDKVAVHLSQNSGVQQSYQQVVLSGFKVN